VAPTGEMLPGAFWPGVAEEHWALLAWKHYIFVVFVFFLTHNKTHHITTHTIQHTTHNTTHTHTHTYTHTHTHIHTQASKQIVPGQLHLARNLKTANSEEEGRRRKKKGRQRRKREERSEEKKILFKATLPLPAGWGVPHS